MARSLRTVLVLMVSAGTLVASAAPASAFSDVPSSYFATREIEQVARQQNWMRDFGTGRFEPERVLSRRHLARAMVRAFAPQEIPDPRLAFTDVAMTDRFWRFVNVAVKLRWMTAPKGRFRPTMAVKKLELDRALVEALGLQAEVKGLNRIATADGYRFKRPPGFAHLVLAQALLLHWNDPSEQREYTPHMRIPRADAAYSLSRAVAARGSWRLASLARYRTIALPAMNENQRMATEYALAQVGYPYVYAGEWHLKTPTRYCCGPQVRGGFDCSGFVWWVMAAPTSGWDNTAYRPYRGWSLPQRSSREMARAATRQLAWRALRPMDLVFYDGDRSHSTWEGIDHVGLYLGKGWIIDSASSRDGVSIAWAADGWYRDHYRWGRRLVGAS